MFCIPAWQLSWLPQLNLENRTLREIHFRILLCETTEANCRLQNLYNIPSMQGSVRSQVSYKGSWEHLVLVIAKNHCPVVSHYTPTFNNFVNCRTCSHPEYAWNICHFTGCWATINHLIYINWLNEWILMPSIKYFMHIQDQSVSMTSDDEWNLHCIRQTHLGQIFNMLAYESNSPQ